MCAHDDEARDYIQVNVGGSFNPANVSMYPREAHLLQKATCSEKIEQVLAAGELSENQYFLPLAFESEGAKAEEVGKLLHAWAKLYKDTRDASNGDMSLLLVGRVGPPKTLGNELVRSCGREHENVW